MSQYIDGNLFFPLGLFLFSSLPSSHFDSAFSPLFHWELQMATVVVCGRALPNSIPLRVISGNFCGARRSLHQVTHAGARCHPECSRLLFYLLYCDADDEARQRIHNRPVWSIGLTQAPGHGWKLQPPKSMSTWRRSGATRSWND